jgi:hypothetical protein
VFAASVVFLFGVLPFGGESVFAVGGAFGSSAAVLVLGAIAQPRPISVIEWRFTLIECIPSWRGMCIGLVPADVVEAREQIRVGFGGSGEPDPFG